MSPKKERDKKKKDKINRKILDIPEEIDMDVKEDEQLEKIRKKNTNTTEKGEKNKKADGKCNADCNIF